MLRKAFLLILISLFLPVQAYYPTVSIKFDNVKIKHRTNDNYEDKFLLFIADFPEVLTPENKKYKIDQACKFNIELDEEGKYLMNTIKVEEMGNNISYNLKAIEFLRQNPIKLTKRDADKSVSIEMQYFAF